MDKGSSNLFYLFKGVFNPKKSDFKKCKKSKTFNFKIRGVLYKCLKPFHSIQREISQVGNFCISALYFTYVFLLDCNNY